MRLTISVILLVITHHYVQGQEWVSLYTQAQQLNNDQEYSRAILTGEKSLQNFLEQDGAFDNNYASILRLLTTACYSEGAYEKGLDYAKKELMVRNKISSAKDLTYAGTLYNLGSLHFMLEQYDKAAPVIEETLKIYQEQYQKEHEDIAVCQWKLAAIKAQLGEKKVAAAIFRESFEDYGNPEAVSMDYLTACYDYGMLLLDQEEFEEAYQYLKNVEDIYKASGYEKSINNANVVKTLAGCLYNLKKYEEANAYYKQALLLFESLENTSIAEINKIKNDQAVCLQALGRSAEAEKLLATINSGSAGGTVSSLVNMAVLSQKKNNYVEAEELYRKALLQVSDTTILSADISEKLGVLKTITGKNDDAADHFKRAEAIILAKFGDKHPRYAGLLVKKAGLLKNQRKYEAAQALYSKAEDIYKGNDNHRSQYATVLNGIAVINQEEGNYINAEVLFRKSLRLIRNSNGTNSSEYASVLNNLAVLSQLKGNLLEAEDLFKEVAAIIENQPDFNELSYAVALDNLGALYIASGDYTSAAEHLKASLKLKEASHGKMHPLYAAGLLNMARLEQAKGQYAKAEPLFKNAVDLQKAALGQDHPGYAKALNGMALLYQTMGNFKAAEPLWLKTKAIYQKAFGVKHPEYATTLENLATLYQLKGDNIQALPLLQEALKIDEVVYGNKHPAYGTTLHNLASLYQDLKQYQKAEQLYQQALIIDGKTFGKNHPSYASTLYNIAILKQDLKKYDEAEELFKETLSIRKQILGENHPDYAYALYGLAAFYHFTGNEERAQELYSETVNHFLDQIDNFFPTLSEKEKSAFYAKIKPVFEGYQDFAVAYTISGEKELKAQVVSKLYDLQLMTKALLLNSSNKVRNRILSSGDEQLITIYNEWIRGKEQLVKFYTYTKKELQQDSIDLIGLDQELNDLEKMLSARSSLFAAEFDNKTYTWKDVQNSLEDHEAAVEILRIKKKYIADSIIYAALVITNETKDHPSLVLLNEGNKLEGRAFNYYHNAIKFSVEDERSYRSFWEPIKNQLKDVRKVYLSSDGIFNKISLNTLWNTVHKNYLLDEIDLKLVSNTKEAIPYEKQSNSIATDKAQLFGYSDFNAGLVKTNAAVSRTNPYGFKAGKIPDLPGTKVEVDKVHTLLKDKDWEVDLHVKAKATEDQLKAVDSPKLLHIATHGYFMSDLDNSTTEAYGIHLNNITGNPLFRSGLLLTGASSFISNPVLAKGQEDGILTAYEAMNLNLDNTELVVLSACETGLGEIKNGEGVYGLQRAFVVAGAKNIIMSLWKVDDETTQKLMSLFYEYWLNGDKKLEAFKKAQLKLKKLHDDPYHWGAFVFLGN